MDGRGGRARGGEGCGTTRRRFLIGAGAGLVAAAAGCQSKVEGRQPVSGARPNILFLLTDDQRWDTLSCAGNPVIRTPNLDALAAQGVRFDNMFVTTSICMSSRASFFTGLYTRSHGIVDFNAPLTPGLFALSYPQRLREAGYRTGFIGKYGVGPVPKDRFDYNKGFPGQGHYFPESKPPAKGALRALTGRHLTGIMTDQVAEFLDGCPRGQPFCLSVSFKSPHCQDGDPRQFLFDPDLADLYADAAIPVPETADPKYFERFPEFVRKSEGRRRWQIRFSTPEKFQEMVKGYFRLVTGVDRAVGRIREALAARGLAENTVIVFAGDNGFYLGEHGLAGKWLMHEESIRVPLIVHDPRRPASERGRRAGEMALNIDLAPTILDLAGLPVPVAMQGRSLVPLLGGAAAGWRREWFYEHTMLADIIPPSEGVRTERFKYIRYLAGEPPFEELYDLATDPRETTNLAADPNHRDRLDAMRRRREAWLEALGRWRLDAPWQDAGV